MPELTYLNFDLETEKAAEGYRAHVLNSPAGEARAVMGALGGATTAGAAPQDAGAALFDAVFRADVLSCLRRSLDAAKRADKGLRIRLRLSETPELASLPWELLYDRDTSTFLALSRETPLVRYLDLPEPAESINPEIKLNVLAVIASPSDYPELDVEREWQNLKAGLADLEARGVVTLERLQPTTVDALQKQLLKQEYHILHFVGHGDYSEDNKDGVLLLTAADGTGDAVSGETFSTLMHDQRSLRLALINACRGAVSGDKDPYSGVAQRLVRGGVPAVIAMRAAISDQAAVALAHSFYNALAAGAAVDEAMAEARKTLYSGGFPNDWATAVLYMRAADGHLWRPKPPPPPWSLQRKILVGVGALAAVALIAFAAWWLLVPAHMPEKNTMNIAVLDVGSVDARGAIQPAAERNLIRSYMAPPLIAASATVEREGVWDNGMGRLRTRSALPVLDDATPALREQSAERLSQAVNAQVVVSGLVDGGDGKRQLTLEVFVFSRLAGEAEETLGYYTLGKPIPMADNFQNDAESKEFVAKELSARLTLLNTALLALREDTFGRHDAALSMLQAYGAKFGLPMGAPTEEPTTEEAPAQGAPSQGADGATPVATPAAAVAKSSADAGSALDILYYFIAREELFLKQYAAAQADASRALETNEKNVRAHIVRGGAYLQESKRIVPQLALLPGKAQALAEADYKRAIELAAPAHDEAIAKGIKTSPIYAITLLGMADAQVTHGENLMRTQKPQNLAAAGDWFGQGLAALDLLTLQALQDGDQWRMVAQYYAVVGGAKRGQAELAARQGDNAAARTLYQAAQAQFEECVKQLDHMREDKTLSERIIDGTCKPGLQKVAAGLAQIGG